MPIDVHAHYVPPQLIAAIKSQGSAIGVRLAPADGGKEALAFDYGFKVRPFFPRLVEPVAERHKWMDEQKIDHQIVGTWPDIFGYGLPRDACIAWHRMLNDTLAEWTADNAQKFSWISSVPLTDAEAAAAELERSADAGAIGAIISSNIENVNLGEFPLDPFWRKAEALGLPILIHPVNVAPAPRTEKFALAQIALYTYDTTLGIGSLLMSGVMDRFPNLKLLWSHGGGTWPYLAGRFDIMHKRMDKAAQGNVAAKTPSAYATQMSLRQHRACAQGAALPDRHRRHRQCPTSAPTIRFRPPTWSRSPCSRPPACPNPTATPSPTAIRAACSRG